MITEDYCSYEVAKLLKEKGFEQYKCQHSYDSKGVFKWSDNLDPYEYSAPTLQMAMKWLRKVHNIHIWVEPNHDKEGLYNAHVKVGWWSNNWAGISYNTYEKAVEAAIKYCLENLI